MKKREEEQLRYTVQEKDGLMCIKINIIYLHDYDNVCLRFGEVCEESKWN